jgi:hypothetical protein
MKSELKNAEQPQEDSKDRFLPLPWTIELAVLRVINHLWPDELQDYLRKPHRECGGHILNSLLEIGVWLSTLTGRLRSSPDVLEKATEIWSLKDMDYVWAVRRRHIAHPIVYELGGGDHEFWADAVGCTPIELRDATESLIRTCHHAAILESKAVAPFPEVYRLGLGCLVVFYTVEREAIVVRGYGENIPRHQCDETMSGGYNCAFG